MTRARLLWLAAAVAACEGRQLTVFDVTAGGPSAGTPPGALSGSSGAGGLGGAAVDQGGGGTNSAAGTVAGGAGDTAGTSAGGTLGGAGDAGDAGAAAGAAGPTPRSCVGDFDCDGGWLCDKPACDAPFGECVPWPAICQNGPAPVCGCDGVTYWNDCVRLRSPSHPPVASLGQCRANARTCDEGSDCNVPYASCSHLLAPGEFCWQGTGSCWVLPPRCAPSDDPKVWRECRPPDQGPPPPFCFDTCLAIRSERPHVELPDEDSCN